MSTNGTLIETFASRGKSFGPISGRLFVNHKFLWPKENMAAMTSTGLKEVERLYIEDHPKEVKGLTLAHGHISGYRFTPIFEGEKVVGTNLVLV